MVVVTSPFIFTFFIVLIIVLIINLISWKYLSKRNVNKKEWKLLALLVVIQSVVITTVLKWF
ncbi:hypothetical protein DEJ56_01430 [Bacillus altitudinis]|nr:hypothetical protein DEJ56_01430 [Bacillus altitudinis]